MKPSDSEPGFISVGIDDDFAAPADWAQLYRRRGMQVVPAYMPGEAAGSWKRPLLKQWVEYQEALVPDEVFDPWYARNGLYVARANMGMICGRASDNLFVIDLDLYKNLGAREWWDGLLAVHNNNMELETVEQRTGGGGCQKIFRAPPGWTVPNKAIPSIAVDIKGQGGFVMLPPSLHESGKAYEWLEGRSPDDIPVMMAPDWLLAAVEALVAQHGGLPTSNGQTSPAPPPGVYDAFGHQVDGREDKMFRMVWASMRHWRQDRADFPSDAEHRQRAAAEYVVYMDRVGPQQQHPAGMTRIDMLTAEGRGPDVWWSKWRSTAKKWHGELADDAAEPDRHPKEDVSRETPRGDPVNRPITEPLMEVLDVRQIKAQPDPVWLIDDLINEHSLGFIFGPPSSLKTFIALDMALSITTGQPTWWGRKINRRGAVIYLCREGVASLKFRILAWEQHRGVVADDAPFLLIKQPMNFMKLEDVRLLLATVEDVARRIGVPIAAIFVDTVSRVLPGAKENQQEDMSLFVGACELLQQRFGCVVTGVHHTNKNGGIRGSTVIPGAGDFLIETRREPPAMTGLIVLQKIKDGEDGVELPFKVTKRDLAGIVLRSSLVIDPDGDAKPNAAGAAGVDGLPDITVCREILAALALAWFQKRPWCKAANGARPAVDMIMGRYQLKRDVVKRLLSLWLANGIIETDTYDKRNRLSGYRKVTDL